MARLADQTQSCDHLRWRRERSDARDDRRVRPQSAEGAAMTDIQEAVAEIKAAGGPKPRAGRDPVNRPMINNWVEALGDRNPIYVDEAAARAVGHPGIVAPPALLQVWTMFGLAGDRQKDDPTGP